MTLTKSYTTRRSQPMIRSRLRRPMSKSMTAVFLPRMARPLAKLALVVVLPTPPLPEVTTTTRVMRSTFLSRLHGRQRLERRDGQSLVAVGVEPQGDAHRPAAEVLEV